MKTTIALMLLVSTVACWSDGRLRVQNLTQADTIKCDFGASTVSIPPLKDVDLPYKDYEACSVKNEAGTITIAEFDPLPDDMQIEVVVMSVGNTDADRRIYTKNIGAAVPFWAGLKLGVEAAMACGVFIMFSRGAKAFLRGGGGSRIGE